QKIVEKTGKKGHKAAVLHEIGQIELNQGHLEEALPYLEEAQQLASEEPGNFSYEILISLGELFSRSSRFKESFSHLKKALDLCRKNGIRHGEILSLYHLGNLMHKTDESEKAAEYWENCYNLTDSMTLRQYRILSGECLVGFYRQTGKYELALNMLETIRNEEKNYREEELHHTISIHDQSMRIEDLDQEMQAWRQRSGELERIRSDKDESIRELEIIRDIGQELTASLDPDRIVEVLHNRLTQLVTVNDLVIAFYLADEKELDVRYIIENGKHLHPTRNPVMLNESLASWVIINDQDLLLQTKKESYKYTKPMYNSDGREMINESYLYVRLKIEGRIIGVLTIQALKNHCYKERHLKLLQALAGFIAIALSNSNAHQSLVLANERIAYMATHDPMTGLPNRMKILDRLEQELNRSRRYKKSLAVLFIDLDGFKQINDTYGHPTGDDVLKEIAKRLSEGVRATDAVGRLAGDEFLVILTDNCTKDNGLHLADNLRQLLSEKIKIKNQSMELTGSVGLAFFPENGNTPGELVNAADQAMYQAKAEGKNRTAILSS
ncbi:MAG: diguanylate cyclase, partial [Spirochaetaceae bacterium]|nr:diguanylate cyclase [Spirochaetaceae bacterium]